MWGLASFLQVRICTALISMMAVLKPHAQVPLTSQLGMQLCQASFNSVNSGPWSASNSSFECPPNVNFSSLSFQAEHSPWFLKNPHHHIWFISVYLMPWEHKTIKLFFFFSFHCVGVGTLRGLYARLFFGRHLRIWLVNNFPWDYEAFQMLTVDLGLFLQITCFILNIIRQLPIITEWKKREMRQRDRDRDGEILTTSSQGSISFNYFN